MFISNCYVSYRILYFKSPSLADTLPPVASVIPSHL